MKAKNLKGNNIDAGAAGNLFSEPLKAAVYLSEECYKPDVSAKERTRGQTLTLDMKTENSDKGTKR